MTAMVCDVCPRACLLPLGATGACRARANVGGQIRPTGFGRVTSIAIDPVEKKPLACWHSGCEVVSLGGYGCNLRCPWCQNHTISQVGERGVSWREFEPQDVVDLTLRAQRQDDRVIGIAYTYNEPLVCWEFVHDTAMLARKAGLLNVLVTAGCVSGDVVREVAPLTDAVNIDLKSVRESTYRMLGGDLATVQDAIRTFVARSGCHVEVTTLVVPGVNDTCEEIDELSRWLASVDPRIVLHVTRFFPAWHKRDCGPTPVQTIYELADVARQNLPRVFTGNC